MLQISSDADMVGLALFEFGKDFRECGHAFHGNCFRSTLGKIARSRIDDLISGALGALGLGPLDCHLAFAGVGDGLQGRRSRQNLDGDFCCGFLMFMGLRHGNGDRGLAYVGSLNSHLADGAAYRDIVAVRALEGQRISPDRVSIQSEGLLLEAEFSLYVIGNDSIISGQFIFESKDGKITIKRY